MNKIRAQIKRIGNRQAGMTYVELIVVLSIFAIMLSISMFNHKKFQSKVDLKNLSNDIALKLVESQKNSLAGKWNAGAVTGWKPSYGLYFNIATPTTFLYFADLNNLGDCTGVECAPQYGVGGEVIDVINITKGNSISAIQSFVGATPTNISTPLTITFKRPNSQALFQTNGAFLTGIDYVQITISSSQSTSTPIKVYPSGRIQIN